MSNDTIVTLVDDYVEGLSMGDRAFARKKLIGNMIEFFSNRNKDESLDAFVEFEDSAALIERLDSVNASKEQLFDQSVVAFEKASRNVL